MRRPFWHFRRLLLGCRDERGRCRVAAKTRPETRLDRERMRPGTRLRKLAGPQGRKAFRGTTRRFAYPIKQTVNEIRSRQTALCPSADCHAEGRSAPTHRTRCAMACRVSRRSSVLASCPLDPPHLAAGGSCQRRPRAGCATPGTAKAVIPEECALFPSDGRGTAWCGACVACPAFPSVSGCPLTVPVAAPRADRHADPWHARGLATCCASWKGPLRGPFL
jgi:hypothetical protein